MDETFNPPATVDTQRQTRCLAALRRVAWDIERDLIRSRRPDAARCFVPDTLSRVGELDFLRSQQARSLSQLQACTYAHGAVPVARCVAAVALRGSDIHWCGDAVALQAQLRVADDALKHQALFRRLALMTATGLPQGYRFVAPDDGLSRAVLRRGRWAAQALSLALVLAAQTHYRRSLEAAGTLCPLWEDVYLFHWKEASQHAVLIELAWHETHARGGDREQQQGIDELAELVDELADAVLQQAHADAQFFAQRVAPDLDDAERAALQGVLQRAYRHQFIGSGLSEPRFVSALQALVPEARLHKLTAHFSDWTSEV